MMKLSANDLRDKKRRALSELVDELNGSLNLQTKQGQGELRPLDAVVMHQPCIAI